MESKVIPLAERCIDTRSEDWSTVRCKRRATVGRYCKQHDPIARKAKADARYKEHMEKWDRQRAQQTIDDQDKLVGQYLRANNSKWYTGLLAETAKESNAHKP